MAPGAVSVTASSAAMLAPAETPSVKLPAVSEIETEPPGACTIFCAVPSHIVGDLQRGTVLQHDAACATGGKPGQRRCDLRGIGEHIQIVADHRADRADCVGRLIDLDLSKSLGGQRGGGKAAAWLLENVARTRRKQHGIARNRPGKNHAAIRRNHRHGAAARIADSAGSLHDVSGGAQINAVAADISCNRQVLADAANADINRPLAHDDRPRHQERDVVGEQENRRVARIGRLLRGKTQQRADGIARPADGDRAVTGARAAGAAVEGSHRQPVRRIDRAVAEQAERGDAAAGNGGKRERRSKIERGHRAAAPKRPAARPCPARACSRAVQAAECQRAATRGDVLQARRRHRVACAADGKNRVACAGKQIQRHDATGNADTPGDRKTVRHQTDQAGCREREAAGNVQCRRVERDARAGLHRARHCQRLAIDEIEFPQGSAGGKLCHLVAAGGGAGRRQRHAAGVCGGVQRAGLDGPRTGLRKISAEQRKCRRTGINAVRSRPRRHRPGHDQADIVFERKNPARGKSRQRADGIAGADAEIGIAHRAAGQRSGIETPRRLFGDVAGEGGECRGTGIILAQQRARLQHATDCKPGGILQIEIATGRKIAECRKRVGGAAERGIAAGAAR